MMSNLTTISPISRSVTAQRGRDIPAERHDGDWRYILTYTTYTKISELLDTAKYHSSEIPEANFVTTETASPEFGKHLKKSFGSNPA